MQAAILRVKLKYLDKWVEGRRAHAKQYREMLGGVDGLTLPIEKPYAKHSYYVYVVRAENRDDVNGAAQGKGLRLWDPLSRAAASPAGLCVPWRQGGRSSGSGELCQADHVDPDVPGTYRGAGGRGRGIIREVVSDSSQSLSPD